MINSKRKPLLIFGFILLALICAGCVLLLSRSLPILALILASFAWSHPIAAPDAFPNAEIIYAGGEGLGFINADGSSQKDLRFRAAGRSVMSEGREIYFMTSDHQTLITSYIGFDSTEGSVAIAQPGERAVDCGWYGITQLAPDQEHILIGTEDGIEEYLLSDCGTGNPPERSFGDASGVLSPDEQYFVETRYQYTQTEGNVFDLLIHDLGSGDERVVEDGRFPAWSRDSQWLAYTGADGIYVIENEANAVPRCVVPIERPDIHIPLYDYGRYPPAVSWSPDGQALVYHVRNLSSEASQTGPSVSIYKVNLVTGEVSKLVDEGMFPYWIWQR
jgi:hypothetical protein